MLIQSPFSKQKWTGSTIEGWEFPLPEKRDTFIEFPIITITINGGGVSYSKYRNRWFVLCVYKRQMPLSIIVFQFESNPTQIKSIQSILCWSLTFRLEIVNRMAIETNAEFRNDTKGSRIESGFIYWITSVEGLMRLKWINFIGFIRWGGGVFATSKNPNLKLLFSYIPCT